MSHPCIEQKVAQAPAMHQSLFTILKYIYFWIMPAKYKSFFCQVVLWVALSFSLHAQLNSKVEHYSTENGLSNNHVMCMTKCSEGFMWFGTWDGVSRFDGHNFKTYTSRPGDSSRLKSTRIDNIVEDKSGYLWLKAYDLQIYRFDKKTGKILAVADMLAKINIKDIVFDKIIATDTGQVWLIARNQGIFHVSNTSSDAPQVVRYSMEGSGDFSLPSNNINFLFEDQERSIWIGTDKGLGLLSLDKTASYKISNIESYHLSNELFTSVGEDAYRVWLGTGSGTVYFYEKALKHLYSQKISANKINAICVSRNNNTLYATTSASELITLNTYNAQVNISIIPVPEPFYSIYEDRSGQLWLQPENLGTVKYNPVDKTFKHFFQKNSNTVIEPSYDVFEDNENRVWVRIKGGGLGYYDADKDRMEYFHKDPGSLKQLLSNVVTCRYFDATGVLWVSTTDRGLEKIVFQRDDFAPKYLVDEAVNKLDNEVRGVYSDNKNRLWIASKAGKLYIQDNEGNRLAHFFVNEPAGGIGPVYTILQDKKGTVWLGTKGNGLFKAEPMDAANTKYMLTHYLEDKNDPYSLSSNLIYSLVEDKMGRVWVGTFENGINLIEERNNRTQFVNSRNELKNYPIKVAGKVRHLQRDETGNLWIGTTNGLIIADITKARPKEVQFQLYRKKSGDKESLGNNDVQFVFRDAKNRMWVATSGGGLNNATGNVHDGFKFKAFTKEDGMPSNYVLSITEDIKGNLWLSTENGLARFSPDNLQFRNYDSYDGLPQTVFSEASALRLSNGNLLFGCISGYLIFSPEKITYQKINAALAFTNFQVNNKDILSYVNGSPLQVDINNTREVRLQYNENVISIDFTVLDYRSNNKQAFAYRLVGLDKEWNNVLDEHKATYTNLAPGHYVFEVKSLSTDLYTNVPSKKLFITILPPPWRTVWAYLIYAVLLVIVIEMVRRTLTTMIRLRNRISVEQRLTELKLNFFTNISHELRTPLTLIVNPINEVLEKEKLSAKGHEYLSLARKNTNRMVRFINQLLDFRKVQSGKMNLKVDRVEMVSFIREIASHFTEAAHEKHIELLVTSNVNELFAWIDADKIDIVIYNLLSNAFKFSGNGKLVEVHIHHIHNKEHFTIEVRDQGIGVPQNKLDDIFELYYEIDKVQNKHHAGTGIGLALSKEIVQLHHGKITARNNPGAGLIVEIELKEGKEHFMQQDFVDPSLDKAGNKEQETAQTEIASVAKSFHHESPLVLIVDDNMELRNYLSDQLSGHYRIAEAEDGQEGWEKAIALMPDLILSDVMMPKLDGIQLLDKLKNNVDTSHIPVILLTAKSSVEHQIEGLSYGADYYITKPFNTNFILASIDNLLKQRKKIFESLLSRKQLPNTSTEEAREAVSENSKDDVKEEAKIVITAKDEAFLNKVIEIVEREMGDPEFNINKVAELLLMGRTTFFKKFKSLTNLAPVEFIRDTRLKRGKEMLDGGEDNMATIALEVGFGSTKYFSTCFKEKYNMSPTEYLRTRKP